jgi:hypothetical protein
MASSRIVRALTLRPLVSSHRGRSRVGVRRGKGERAQIVPPPPPPDAAHQNSTNRFSETRLTLARNGVHNRRGHGIERSPSRNAEGARTGDQRVDLRLGTCP